MSDKVYNSSAWQRIRRQILERDGYVCRINGPKCTYIATDCDHIVPMSQGGAAYDNRNLRASCAPCNLGRVDRTRVVDADAGAVIARLRALGLHEAADLAEQQQALHDGPSRDW